MRTPTTDRVVKAARLHVDGHRQNTHAIGQRARLVGPLQSGDLVPLGHLATTRREQLAEPGVDHRLQLVLIAGGLGLDVLRRALPERDEGRRET